MRRRWQAQLVLVLLAACAQVRAAPLKVVVLGDSTACDYPDTDPLRGWGQVIGRWFTPDATWLNLAESGRSTKTYLLQGRLWHAVSQRADYALIQFGHVDSQGTSTDRGTDPETDFRTYLRLFIDEFRRVGTQPVVVTPLHRRRFGQDGSPSTELLPYVAAMKAVAAEAHAPVIDMWAASGKLLQELGPVESVAYFLDITHTYENGALAMAKRVVEGLGKACPPLAALCKPVEQQPVAR